MTLMKKYIIFAVVLFSLASCGSEVSKENSEQTQNEKIPFQIEIQEIKNFNKNITEEKTGLVKASSTLVLSAKTSGEIEKIFVKEGDKIGKGKTIANLRDNIFGYNLAVKSARARLHAQQLQKNATSINLDSSIISAEANYEKAREGFQTTKGNTHLSYNLLSQANKDALDSHNETYKTTLQSLEQQMTQYLHEGDKILGMTDIYDNQAEKWEDDLGIHNGNGRKDAKEGWDSLYAARGKLRKIIQENKNLQDGDINKKLDELDTLYKETQKMVESMIRMIQNNRSGAGYIIQPQQQQMWTQTWNQIQSSLQASYTRFTSWRGGLTPFLNNYKDKELATKLATIRLSRPLTPEELDTIENNPELKIHYQEALLKLQNSNSQAKIALTQAEKMLENTKKVKIANLAQIQAGIDSARIALQQAQYNAAKLRISAPMSGIITKILVEKGQSISTGTPIAEFASNTPEVQVEIAPSLASMVNVGEEMKVEIDGETLSGTITARSLVAGKNLLSSLRISLPNNTDFIGKTAKISFPKKLIDTSKNHILLPLTVVQIISENEGEITTLTPENTLKKQKVMLGKILGKNIEVIINLPQNTKVVLTDTKNFDAGKFDLVVK
ncbi:HlyD family efflux transporter periplasmic adaptor subunit [Candidatus Gracilibacteria bacterium]|nr:HlyD family efflux transporter periplasmic adaptor subunit [Candidatus Gracilibacteria bacterium]